MISNAYRGAHDTSFRLMCDLIYTRELASEDGDGQISSRGCSCQSSVLDDECNDIRRLFVRRRVCYIVVALIILSADALCIHARRPNCRN